MATTMCNSQISALTASTNTIMKIYGNYANERIRLCTYASFLHGIYEHVLYSVYDKHLVY